MRRVVGLNVRRARLTAGMTQERLAELSGRTQQYISGLESGRRNPTVIVLFEIAQVLGKRAADLLAE